MFAHLDRAEGAALNDALTHAGFRRSQSIVYRPACEECDACLSSRVPVASYVASRNVRRIAKRNADLVRIVRPAHATQEQFELLSRYLSDRHAEGGMTDMTFGDYAMMTADSPARTEIAEYRLRADNSLVAVALVDRLSDGYSLVYSYFDPDDAKRSLGTFMIYDHIERARAEGFAYVYLGYWVKDSDKMAYKARFQPLEVLRSGGWRLLSEAEIGTDAAAADAAAD